MLCIEQHWVIKLNLTQGIQHLQLSRTVHMFYVSRPIRNIRHWLLLLFTVSLYGIYISSNFSSCPSQIHSPSYTSAYPTLRPQTHARSTFKSATDVTSCYVTCYTFITKCMVICIICLVTALQVLGFGRTEHPSFRTQIGMEPPLTKTKIVGESNMMMVDGRTTIAPKIME